MDTDLVLLPDRLNRRLIMHKIRPFTTVDTMLNGTYGWVPPWVMEADADCKLWLRRDARVYTDGKQPGYATLYIQRDVESSYHAGCLSTGEHDPYLWEPRRIHTDTSQYAPVTKILNI